jgi:hypothetical protein
VEEGYPQTYCGDGDGTLTIESVRICKWWKDNDLNGGYQIDYQEVPGQTHVGILTDPDFIQTLQKLIETML